MKKLFAVLFMMILTCSSASAYQEVNYGPIGQTSSYSRSGFGSNASFLPANRRAIAYRVRQVRRYEAETYAIRNRNNHNINLNLSGNMGGNNVMTSTMASKTTSPELSRFNKNTKISSQKAYTKNGITYYN